MRRSRKLLAVLALALAVGLATAVSPFASAHPDGLERVALDQGFADSGELAPIQQSSPVPDYAFPGVGDDRLATAAAGFAGTLGIFAVGIGMAWAVRRRDAAPAPGVGRVRSR